MQRRTFITNSLVATGIAAAGIPAGAFAASDPAKKGKKNQFKLRYAPHFGMFENSAGKDLIDQLRFMADQGFPALEDNGLLGRPADVQDKIGRELERLGMTMGVFVVDAGDNWKVSYTTGQADFAEKFLQTCHQSVELAKRVNAKWMTVVPGYFARQHDMGLQTANVIGLLRRAADIFEPHGLVMVLEPLSDNPDLFLRFSGQTYMICKAVNSPSCKILFDIYHMQRNEGNLIANIDACWDEIGYFQIGDNPGRKEPGTGEINYKNIFRHIHAKNTEFIMGMEHGNAHPGADGEEKLIAAYAEADSF
jgi:hydroxypyruvate isomerase